MSLLKITAKDQIHDEYKYTPNNAIRGSFKQIVDAFLKNMFNSN